MLQKIEGRRRGRQRMRWLDGVIGSVGVSLKELWQLVKAGKPVLPLSVGSWRGRRGWTAALFSAVAEDGTQS